MAKALVLQFNGTDLPFSTEKVDRTKLYGFIDVEALDDQGRRCHLATLADDGRTIIGMGGTAFAQLSPDGEWLDKSKLKPVDPEGKPIVPVPSSYSAPVPLARTASIEEYLSHNIKSVYLLRCEGDLSALLAELKKGTIYTFPYSYRGGLEADAGFLLASQDGQPFLAVGQPTTIHFVGLEQAAALTEEESSGEDDGDESVDFGMM
ncbi:MAG: hypothetical protein KIS92_16970 [Planctomycetota bacterium]|nr:hypothetical protein [Planctomycetota bacterium]